MSPHLREIERRAIRLAGPDREMLAERLIQSLDRVPLTDVEEAWVREAERRFASYRRGARKGIPASLAFKRIRKGLGC